MLDANMEFSLTPFKTYAAVDCPRYSNMYGPRCNTAKVPAVGDTGVRKLDEPPSVNLFTRGEV